MSEKVVEKKRGKNGKCIDVVEFIRPDGGTSRRSVFVKEDGRPGERAPKRETQTVVVDNGGSGPTDGAPPPESAVKPKRERRQREAQLSPIVAVVAVLSTAVVAGVAALFFTRKAPRLATVHQISEAKERAS